MIFFAALGVAATLIGYSCFTLRIASHRSMLVSHFVTYYGLGLGACYFLEMPDSVNMMVGVLGLMGGLAWYCIIKLFIRVEERFGRNENPRHQS
jgi:hypothetical protein